LFYPTSGNARIIVTTEQAHGYINSLSQ